MTMKNFTRRGFLGGAAAAVGTLALPDIALAKGIRRIPGWKPHFAPQQSREAEYDALAHLSSNENPFGPSQKTLDAMTHAFKYAMRYGYPDNDVTRKIADAHGVGTEHIALGAGSSETLEMVGLTYLGHDKKVIGVQPTYLTVFGTATGIDADAIMLPLKSDYTQDVEMIVDAAKRHYRELGLVYLCNPNNPTGAPMTASEIAYVVENVPEDVPILIDEAYHHFVEDPAYEESIKYVTEGRRVVIARTFSKLYGLAGVRIGFGIAPPDMIQEMAPYTTGTISALARYAAVAAMEDTASQQMVLDHNRHWREQTRADLASLGYESIPSSTNFFMVDLGRRVAPVREAFRDRRVAVGRDFPPMLNHLRVSIGSEEEMGRFMNAFEDVMRQTATNNSGG